MAAKVLLIIKVNVNVKDKDRWIVLYMAAKRGYKIVAKLLAEKEVNIKAKDIYK